MLFRTGQLTQSFCIYLGCWRCGRRKVDSWSLSVSEVHCYHTKKRLFEKDLVPLIPPVVMPSSCL